MDGNGMSLGIGLGMLSARAMAEIVLRTHF